MRFGEFVAHRSTNFIIALALMTIGGSEALNVGDRFDIPNDDPVHDKHGAMLSDTTIVRRPGSSAPPPVRWPALPRPCQYLGRYTALRQQRIRRHHPVFAAPTALAVFWEWHRNRRRVRKDHCPS